MKTINDFTFEQQKQIVANDNKLNELFAGYLEESEIYWIMEKLEFVKKSLSNYEISPWCYSFYKIREGKEFEFVDGVDDSRKMFGLSTKCEKILNRCKGLKYTNLFNFYFQQLVETFWSDEILDTLNWVQNNAFNLENDAKGELNDVFSCFLDNGYLDGYEFEQDEDDDDEITVYGPRDKRTIHI